MVVLLTQYMTPPSLVGLMARHLKNVFFDIFIKNLEGESPFGLIGDNLGSHFREEVINVCVEKNIRFITLVPNSTHLCQGIA